MSTKNRNVRVPGITMLSNRSGKCAATGESIDEGDPIRYLGSGKVLSMGAYKALMEAHLLREGFSEEEASEIAEGRIEQELDATEAVMVAQQRLAACAPKAE